MIAELLIIGTALVLALAARPWQLYGYGLAGAPQRSTRWIAPVALLLAILPSTWVLPGPGPIAAQMHWSAACLATLVLGWPAAIPLFVLVALPVSLIAPGLSAPDLIAMVCWQGVVPSTISLGIGVALRRLIGEHLFVYLLGRAFLGTVISVFIAGAIQQWLHAPVPAPVGDGAFVARWLMAWGDGVVTGMLTTIFVVFAPTWLATWSDARYLRPPDPKTGP